MFVRYSVNIPFHLQMQLLNFHCSSTTEADLQERFCFPMAHPGKHCSFYLLKAAPI